MMNKSLSFELKLPLFCLILTTGLANCAFAQVPSGDSVFSRVTTKEARAARYRYLVDTTIKQFLLDTLNDENEGEWSDALWTMELLQYKDAFTKQKLIVAWNKALKCSDEFQRNLLETTYSLYTKDFRQQALHMMQQTKSTAIFIRCAEYVLRADSSNGKNMVKALIQKKFPTDTSVGLQVLQSRLKTARPESLPPLEAIFDTSFLPGQTVIYSLQRSNRAYAGIAIIRKPGGGFVKDSSGNYFYAAQLARAVSNYPFYITNGNTPQGILRFSGFDVSKLLYIGPTTNLQMQLPFEDSPHIFFADSSMIDTTWSTALYATMLPPTWRLYQGIYESFYAGEMGRSAIIMHGTTIDPLFYKAQTYYPQTPSLGCLCSYEEWNDAGYRVKSNQQNILNALNSLNVSNGFVVVIDIDDQYKDVSIDEVKALLDKQSF